MSKTRELMTPKQMKKKIKHLEKQVIYLQRWLMAYGVCPKCGEIACGNGANCGCVSRMFIGKKWKK